MDLNKQLEVINDLINKSEDKEIIGTLGSLADSLKEQDKSFKEQEEQYLNEISKWRDCYKESILKGGFQSNEVSKQAEPVQEQHVPSFEELLSKYAK